MPPLYAATRVHRTAWDARAHTIVRIELHRRSAQTQCCHGPPLLSSQSHCTRGHRRLARMLLLLLLPKLHLRRDVPQLANERVRVIVEHLPQLAHEGGAVRGVRCDWVGSERAG